MADIVKINGGDAPATEPDAHGQAALMLSESILHALVELRAITTENALAIVESAQEVKEDVGKEMNESPRSIAASVQLLGRIASSFATDLV